MEEEEYTLLESLERWVREYSSYLLVAYTLICLLFAPVEAFLWVLVPLYGSFHFRFIDQAPRVLVVGLVEHEAEVNKLIDSVEVDFDVILKIRPSDNEGS